jgi:hypothetical protein
MAGTQIVGEPYALDGKRMPFVTWEYVRPGSFGWYDAKGNNVTVSGDQRLGEAQLRRTDTPSGIRLKVEPGRRGAAVLTAQTEWERGGFPTLTNIIADAGRYRAWGRIGGWGDLRGRGPSYFCYFESDDAMNWRRPDCGVYELNGSTRNNILDTEGGGVVFIDPSAEADERYKWIAEAHFNEAEVKAFHAVRHCGVDSKAARPDAGFTLGVRGAVSPDGLRWKVLETPLALMHADTQLVGCYDARLRKYVAYVRDWAVGDKAPAYQGDTSASRWLGIGRRAIGRAETDDFREFPLSQIILEAPLWMAPSQVLYTNTRTTFPGCGNQQLMFPAVWDQATDRTHLALAGSSDGICWNWISHSDSASALFDTAEPGQWDGGCIFAHPSLLELPGGDFALPYTGNDVPHKYPRQRAQRATGYAIWPKGRLAGIYADGEGSFATAAVAAPGRGLRINARTDAGGSVRIEACGLEGKPIPGRTFEDATALTGDCYQSPVTWRGQDSLGIEPGAPVLLRFRLKAASVFWVEFV